MTTLPSLEPCAHCGHVQGDHRSTAGGGFSLHPVRYGRCQLRGCDCTEWKSGSDQSESEQVVLSVTMTEAAADRFEEALRWASSQGPSRFEVDPPYTQKQIKAFEHAEWLDWGIGRIALARRLAFDDLQARS